MNCIILARGGSKGVPGKNIRLLNNKPLLAYPILAAQGTREIDNIFVSTDSEEIAKVAKEYGASVIERPAHLAGDFSLDVDAFRHAIGVLKDYSDVVQLRATTPMLNSKILDAAIDLFKNNNECTSMRSAHEFSESVYKFFKLEGKYWTGFFPHLEGEYYNFSRQSFPASYLPNGYIDIVRPVVFMNQPTFHGDKILSFITPYTIEVDTEEDFRRLEREYV